MSSHGKGFEWLDKKLTPSDKKGMENKGALTSRERHVRSILKGARERLSLRLDMAVTKASSGFYPLLGNEWLEFLKECPTYNSHGERDDQYKKFLDWGFNPMKPQFASVSLGYLAVWSSDYGLAYFELVSISHYDQGVTKADRILNLEEEAVFVEESREADQRTNNPEGI